MTYEEAVKRIYHLSQITKNQDIYGTCKAIAGGIFCPAHGVAFAAPYIRDAAIVVVGMAECTWYAKNTGVYYAQHTADERFYSCVLEEEDIAFGFGEQLVGQIAQVVEQTHCACVILASTCIPEIIGEDIEQAALQAEQQCGCPVLLVHTSHFDYKCYEYEIAVERLLLSLGKLMRPQPIKPGSVNYLGVELHFQHQQAAENELTRLLKEHGVSTNLILLNSCTTEEIKKAPAAQLNIVTHRVGLPLAKWMEQAFHTPYTVLEPSWDLAAISQAYEKMEQALRLRMPQWRDYKGEALEAIEKARPICCGKTVINGGRPPDAIETTAFLVSLGMHPLLINAARIYPTTAQAIAQIEAAGFDPYVNYVANHHITQAFMSRQLPDLYIGHGSSLWVKKFPCARLDTVKPENTMGFEAVAGGADRVRNALLLQK